MDTWTVYILNCSDGRTYTGCSKNLYKRIIKHNRGEVHSTKSRLPVSLVVNIVFYNKYKAYTFERYLKSGSGRAFAIRHFI